jgi:hypothetical protein
MIARQPIFFRKGAKSSPLRETCGPNDKEKTLLPKGISTSYRPILIFAIITGSVFAIIVELNSGKHCNFRNITISVF